MIMLPTSLIDAHPLLSTLLIALMGMVAVALAASVRVMVMSPGRSKTIPIMCFLLSAYVAVSCNQFADDLDVERAVFLLSVFLMVNMVLVELCKRRRSY